MCHTQSISPSIACLETRAIVGFFLNVTWQWHTHTHTCERTDAHTHTHKVHWYHLAHPAKHRDHLWATNQKADTIWEFLLLSAQILPSIINKEKNRNMMGKAWGHRIWWVGTGEGVGGLSSADRGFSREVKTRKEVFPLTLSASAVLPRREGKNLIIELLKISLLAQAHLHVWERAQQEPTWGRPFCAWCGATVPPHSRFLPPLQMTRLNVYLRSRHRSRHPLCGQWMIASIKETERSRRDLKAIIELEITVIKRCLPATLTSLIYCTQLQCRSDTQEHTGTTTGVYFVLLCLCLEGLRSKHTHTQM